MEPKLKLGPLFLLLEFRDAVELHLQKETHMEDNYWDNKNVRRYQT
jgi:hypothetical protein